MADKIRYFFRGQGASMLWDTKKNVITAMCDAHGIYATAKASIAEQLKQCGFKEVDAEMLTGLGFTELPAPDKLDHDLRALKYAPWG